MWTIIIGTGRYREKCLSDTETRNTFWNFMCNWKWYKWCFNMFSPEELHGWVICTLWRYTNELYENLKLNNIFNAPREWIRRPMHNLLRCSQNPNVCLMLQKLFIFKIPKLFRLCGNADILYSAPFGIVTVFASILKFAWWAAFGAFEALLANLTKAGSVH